MTGGTIGYLTTKLGWGYNGKDPKPVEYQYSSSSRKKTLTFTIIASRLRAIIYSMKKLLIRLYIDIIH